MSRPTPGQAYGYATHPATPANYYYEDPEEYVGDYSENDALSDAAPRLLATPNVTEIYRRKSALAPTPEHYRQQNMYVPSSYYYEAVPAQVSQQMRRPAMPTAYRRAVPVVDDRAHYYTSGPSGALEDGYRNTVVYSSPQIAAVRRSTTYATPVTRTMVRKHPVTVRTPRYYRRPTVTNVYKKPSTLCIPLACQPDPAVYRRPRKHPEEPNYTPQQLAFAQQAQTRPIIRRHSVPVSHNATKIEPPKPRPVDYSGDLHLTQSDVDAVLARYETILGDQPMEVPPAHKSTSCSSKSSCKSKLLSHLKPKVPSSIKQKQGRLQKGQESLKPTPREEKQKHRPNSPCERIEVEQITTDVLDSMLSELMDSGCENRINEMSRENASDVQSTARKSEYSEKSFVQRPPSGVAQRSPSGVAKEEANQYPKSFNYRDISQHMSKSQHELYPTVTVQATTNSQTSSPLNSPRFEPPTVNQNNNCNKSQPSNSMVPTYTADDNCAMELHRSKSYIVSLIDRALSKELGTVPDEKVVSVSSARETASVKVSDQMNARQAIDLINKNFEKMDKGLCLEITQALTDSVVSNATASCPRSEIKHGTCSCNVQDEPLYVKQLKQLRWGHLKHIQREVRRLEDLERFLDSCSSESPQ